MELDPFFDCNWESESQPRWHAKNHTLDVGFDSDDGEGLEGMEYIWSCMSWRSDTPCLELERTLHDMRNDEEACHFGFSVKVRAPNPINIIIADKYTGWRRRNILVGNREGYPDPVELHSSGCVAMVQGITEWGLDTPEDSRDSAARWQDRVYEAI